MKVPTAAALMLIQRSGHHCTPATLRQWVRRGHIQRHGHGMYDLIEITTYLSRRDAARP